MSTLILHLNTDGWRGFYRGFIPAMLRSFPTNGAALFVFERVHRVVLGGGTYAGR